ncbi:MAG: SGNH/GDSL hydrolase family protein [Planctomycetia bacterium]|nr:SGNH/GDSL hydrolase family protein [Planctomycetia bacterium]
MPQKSIGFTPVLVLAACALAGTGNDSVADQPQLKIFDGKPRTVVTIANSHGGGRGLKMMMDRYFDGKSPMVFKNVSGWSTPVDPKTGAVQPGSWLEKFSLEKEKALSHPIIVIALAGVALPPPPRKGEAVPVNDETVKRGVETLEKFVQALKDKGADEVFVSTYHYFDVAAQQGWNAQYNIDYTLKVYEAYNQKSGLHRAIDCITMTKEHHPLIVGDDQFHPNAAGHAVFTHCWFEALLKHDGLEVPKWSLEEMDAALAKQKQAEK